MRALSIILTLVAALWGGYWFVGSSAVETGLTRWLDERGTGRWIANYSTLETKGFPNRFDTTISNLELSDPLSGVSWRMPFFQILALSYKPNHIIAVWPDSQSISTPDENITIDSQRMRGSVVFDASTDLALNRSSVVLDQFDISSDAGWGMNVVQALFAVRQTVGQPDFYDIAVETRGVKPGGNTLKRFDPKGRLPDEIELMKIDATLGFDAPWDRLAIETRLPRVTDINLKTIQANWGKLDLRLTGKLTVDQAGVPSGEISVTARNWKDMFEIAVASGLVPPKFAPTLETGLNLLAGMSGTPDTIDAPLNLKNGTVWMGPVPLGPIPRFTLN